MKRINRLPPANDLPTVCNLFQGFSVFRFTHLDWGFSFLSLEYTFSDRALIGIGGDYETGIVWIDFFFKQYTFQ